MEILQKAFGEYQTNCYILKFEHGQIVIDPGVGAVSWVRENCKNPLAILNTHGHFDHVWDNALLLRAYPHIQLICHKSDVFLLENDCFNLSLPVSSPTKTIDGIKNTTKIIVSSTNKGDKKIKGEDIEVAFHHFPGHTPGCCMIEVGDKIFSGDFIFANSIGRSDFAYSDSELMRESLLRFRDNAHFSEKIFYPGHGVSTNGRKEQENIKFWLDRI